MRAWAAPWQHWGCSCRCAAAGVVTMSPDWGGSAFVISGCFWLTSAAAHGVGSVGGSKCSDTRPWRHAGCTEVLTTRSLVLQGLAGGLALLSLFMTYLQYITAGRDGFLAYYSAHAQVRQQAWQLLMLAMLPAGKSTAPHLAIELAAVLVCPATCWLIATQACHVSDIAACASSHAFALDIG